MKEKASHLNNREKGLIKLLFMVFILSFGFANAQQDNHIYKDSISLEKRNILNEIFKDYRGEKDFKNMKVAFFSSPGGTVQRFNEHYFKVLDLNDLNTKHPLGYLIFFTPKEKDKHSYDVAIVYVSKNSQPRLNRRLIKTKKDYLKKSKIPITEHKGKAAQPRSRKSSSVL